CMYVLGLMKESVRHCMRAGGHLAQWENPYSHLVPAGPDPAYLTQDRDTKGLLSGIVRKAEVMSSYVPLSRGLEERAQHECLSTASAYGLRGIPSRPHELRLARRRHRDPIPGGSSSTQSVACHGVWLSGQFGDSVGHSSTDLLDPARHSDWPGNRRRCRNSALYGRDNREPRERHGCLGNLDCVDFDRCGDANYRASGV